MRLLADVMLSIIIWFVLVPLGFVALYGIASLVAQVESDSWLARVALALSIISLLIVMALGSYVVLVGLRSLFHESAQVCIVLLAAAFYEICFWRASKEREAKRKDAKTRQASWAQRLAKVSEETDTPTLERLYDEGLDIQIENGKLYGNYIGSADDERIDRALDGLKNILRKRGVFRL